MVDFGYDIADFRDVDDTFGTMQDFEELTKKAKELGIKVSTLLQVIGSRNYYKFYFVTIGSYGSCTKSYI